MKGMDYQFCSSAFYSRLITLIRTFAAGGAALPPWFPEGAAANPTLRVELRFALFLNAERTGWLTAGRPWAWRAAADVSTEIMGGAPGIGGGRTLAGGGGAREQRAQKLGLLGWLRRGNSLLYRDGCRGRGIKGLCLCRVHRNYDVGLLLLRL
jgi:hypothetical protein